MEPTHYITTQSRRKYVFTDQIDQLIREVYLNLRGAKTRPGIPLLAKKADRVGWQVNHQRRYQLCRDKSAVTVDPGLQAPPSTIGFTSTPAVAHDSTLTTDGE